MNWSARIRQFHRWMAVVFTVLTIVVIVAFAQGEPDAWIPYLPLYPLLLMFLTGSYMFVLPYVLKRRERRSS